MQNLKGKVALVTGSAKRLGAMTIRKLHEQGANVVIHYRSSADNAENLAAELNALRKNSCFLQQSDLANIDALPLMIENIIQHYSRLDILVNNASSFFPTSVGEITESHWDNLMASNLKVPLFLSQAAMPHLKKSKGCIVNMVDIHGINPLLNHPVYSAAKAGLLMLTKSLALELGPDIRVNGIAPGAILWPEASSDVNPDVENSTEEILDDEQQKLLSKTCLKKQGSPEDIAKAILFLVKDADYITGHIIPVDGGRLVGG